MHKFLHLADIHLDSAILCRSESLRKKLREELRRGFERAIDCAIEEKVIAVLIAGDLLDTKNFSMDTEVFLREQFARLNDAHIPVIYTSGLSDSPEEVQRVIESPLPANVIHIKGHSPKIIELQDMDGVAYSACCWYW